MWVGWVRGWGFGWGEGRLEGGGGEANPITQPLERSRLEGKEGNVSLHRMIASGRQAHPTSGLRGGKITSPQRVDSRSRPSLVRTEGLVVNRKEYRGVGATLQRTMLSRQRISPWRDRRTRIVSIVLRYDKRK